MNCEASYLSYISGVGWIFLLCGSFAGAAWLRMLDVYFSNASPLLSTVCHSLECTPALETSVVVLCVSTACLPVHITIVVISFDHIMMGRSCENRTLDLMDFITLSVTQCCEKLL